MCVLNLGLKIQRPYQDKTDTTQKRGKKKLSLQSFWKISNFFLKLGLYILHILCFEVTMTFGI